LVVELGTTAERVLRVTVTQNGSGFFQVGYHCWWGWSVTVMYVVTVVL